MLASATMIAAAVYILVESLRESHDAHADVTVHQESMQSVLPMRLVIMVLLITGYLVAMPAIGFLLSSAAFLLASFSYLWRKPFLVSLLITVVSVASVYIIFRKLFQVVLPNGSLIQGLF